MLVTLVIKFSRRWCLVPFFENFKKLKFPEEKINLLAINNTSDDVITQGMMSYISPMSEKFKEIHIMQTNEKVLDRYHPYNFKEVPLPFHTHSARRSFELQKLICSLVKTSIHIQFEDDTLSHPNCIIALMAMMKREDVVAATTPCPHRQKGFKVVGHNAYNIMEFNGEGFLTRRSNYPVYREGIYEVEGTGYCGIAFRKEAFESALSWVERLPFRIIGSGSDIYVTSHMKKGGGKILCDFSCWNVHMDLQGTEIIQNTVENCKPWDWVWRPRRGAYRLKFVGEDD